MWIKSYKISDTGTNFPHSFSITSQFLQPPWLGALRQPAEQTAEQPPETVQTKAKERNLAATTDIANTSTRWVVAAGKGTPGCLPTRKTKMTSS